MSPRAPSIFNSFVILLVLGVGLMGCVNTPSASDEDEQSETMASLGIRPEKIGFSKNFRQSFDSVWRAAQITLKYPIAVNNVETGVIETDWVRSEEGYQPPLQERAATGSRFKVQINMVRGVAGGKPVTRVVIHKTIEKRPDFFSDEQKMESNGLEEKILLYRIDRELVIDDSLKKAAAAADATSGAGSPNSP